MKLKVEISLLKNGRINPIKVGYRPHMVSVGGQGDFGVIEIFDKNIINPGETFEGIILIANPLIFKEFLENSPFAIYEGKKIVGTGKILKILGEKAVH